jgi:hypothetical protein
MRRSRLASLAFCLGALILVGGCQTVGPRSIGMGRDRYNGVLHSTSMEQTMSNIVRAYNYEPPMFMDVTEIDASLQAGASASGGVNNIGAKPGAMGGTLAGKVGTASGGVQYSENPTVRYQPLLGQALVAQLVTPVTVDALGQLYDSYWDTAALLDLSSAYLTPDYREFYAALNTIIELSHQGALELAAGKSFVSSGQGNQQPPATWPAAVAQLLSAKPPPQQGNDALDIFLRPFQRGATDDDMKYKSRVLRLWVRLLRIYIDSQPPFGAPSQCGAIGLSLDRKVLRDWDVDWDRHVTGTVAQQDELLRTARDCLPNVIELRESPLPPANAVAPPSATMPKLPYGLPVIRTYSALGILKNATERPGNKIEFVTPAEYRRIRADAWNSNSGYLSFYTLLPEELDSFNCPASQKAQGGCDLPLPPSQQSTNTDIGRWIRAYSGETSVAYPSGLDVYEQPGQDFLDSAIINMNGRLGTLRRYILVIVDDHNPGNSSYASYWDGGRWFYIEKGDMISEKNFQLLALFMTMMAVPPTTPPLSPSINVGG